MIIELFDSKLRSVIARFKYSLVFFMLIHCMVSVSQIYNNGFVSIIDSKGVSIAKYFENLVIIFNEQIGVSIPLKTFENGNIELTLAFWYNKSGIQVSEESSCSVYSNYDSTSFIFLVNLFSQKFKI